MGLEEWSLIFMLHQVITVAFKPPPPKKKKNREIHKFAQSNGVVFDLATRFYFLNRETGEQD